MTANPLDALYPAHLAEWGRRTDRALEAAGCEALVIGSGRAPMQFQDDQPYPFKVCAYFKAWAPLLDAPGSFIVYRPGRRPTMLFYQPDDYWHQPPALPTDGWAQAFDWIRLTAPSQAAASLPERAAYLGPVGSWPADGPAVVENPPAALLPLDYARARKTPYEIECLRLASDLAVRGHLAARDAWRSGASEFAIHLAYLHASGHQEEELPYSSIIAANEAAAVLHYTVRRREAPPQKRSFLIDAGAQVRGYASDVTRTYAASAGDFAALIDALEALQQQLCALVTPGRSYPDIHLETHRGIARILCDAGLARGSPEAVLDARLTSVFFPHGIGHLLGLQVHDVGGFQASEQGGLLERPPGHPYLRLTRRLEDGFVVTIEPGLYFIPLLLDQARADGRSSLIDWGRVEALSPYGGIRIEDDVVATARGPRNLTREAFAAA